MHKFEYTTRISEINSIKTVKRLREVIYGVIPNLKRYSVSEVDRIFMYKLASLAYKRYTSKSKVELPTISTTLRDAQQRLINSLMLSKGTLEVFLDVFEYDTEVVFPRHPDVLEYFQGVVVDYKLPFTVDIEENLSNFERYAYTPIHYDAFNFKVLFNLVKHIRLKQVYANRRNNYLLDLTIAKDKKAIRRLSKNSINTSIEYLEDSEVLLKQHLKAITATKKYLKGLNNEPNTSNKE